MIEIFGLDVSSKVFFYIMVSFSFFVGIILMVSPEAFENLNHALRKEYGFKIKLVPFLENTFIDTVDKIIVKNRVIAGIIISVTAFALLIIFK